MSPLFSAGAEEEEESGIRTANRSNKQPSEEATLIFGMM